MSLAGKKLAELDEIVYVYWNPIDMVVMHSKDTYIYQKVENVVMG